MFGLCSQLQCVSREGWFIQDCYISVLGEWYEHHSTSPKTLPAEAPPPMWCDGIPCFVMLLDQNDRNQVSSPVPIGNHCFAAVYAPPSATEEPRGHKLFSILNFPLSPGPNDALFQFLQPFPSLSFVILSDGELINFSFASLDRGSSLGDHYRANCQCLYTWISNAGITFLTRKPNTSLCQSNMSLPAINLHRNITTWWGQAIWFSF